MVEGIGVGSDLERIVANVVKNNRYNKNPQYYNEMCDTFTEGILLLAKDHESKDGIKKIQDGFASAKKNPSVGLMAYCEGLRRGMLNSAENFKGIIAQIRHVYDLKDVLVKKFANDDKELLKNLKGQYPRTYKKRKKIAEKLAVKNVRI